MAIRGKLATGIVTRTAVRRLTVMAVAIAVPGAAVPAAAALTASPSWHIAKIFSASSGVQQIDSVDAVNAHDAWLVGETFPAAAGQAPITVERWFRGTWRQVPVPASANPGGVPLAGDVVAASSETNAWVFADDQGSAGPNAVALGWNGHKWRTHAFPLWSAFNAAAVFSSTNVWAFGQNINGKQTPLVVRYNGHAWRKVSVPLIPQGASAISPTDIWTVGPTVQSVGKPTAPVFAAARWNGHRWHELRLPHLALPKGAVLWGSDVLALSRTNVWVSGWLAKGQGVFPGYVLLHLTAHGWKRIRVPFPAGSLTAITRDGRGGIELTVTSDTSIREYFYHYLNGHWTRQLAPSSAHHITQLAAISWAPGARFGWAGGEIISGGNSQGALLRYVP